METSIIQQDYNKFYEDIMELVWFGLGVGDKSWLSEPLSNRFELGYKKHKENNTRTTTPKYNSAIPPVSAIPPRFRSKDNDTDGVSLNERKYGCFIDEYYKEAFVRAKNSNNIKELWRLEFEIAFIIRDSYKNENLDSVIDTDMAQYIRDLL